MKYKIQEGYLKEPIKSFKLSKRIKNMGSMPLKELRRYKKVTVVIAEVSEK